MKQCAHCHETKPTQEFHKNRTRPDGYAHYCKTCMRPYLKSDRARAYFKAYKKGPGRNSERRRQKKASRRRRAKDPETYRAYMRERYRRLYSPSVTGRPRPNNPEGSRKWRAQHPEKRRAHKAVEAARRAGLLVKQACVVCGTPDDVHAHHADYSCPLDVVWLCRPCHSNEHVNVRNSLICQP